MKELLFDNKWKVILVESKEDLIKATSDKTVGIAVEDGNMNIIFEPELSPTEYVPAEILLVPTGPKAHLGIEIDKNITIFKHRSAM